MYEQVFSLFSTTVAHLPNNLRPKLNDLDDLLRLPELPVSYKLFLKHEPHYLPSGWEMMGLSEGKTTFVSLNQDHQAKNKLPIGWVCFANVSDDTFYFFVKSSGSLEDSVVMCACGDDFDNLQSKAKLIAPTFASFLLHCCQGWIDEQKQSFERLHSDAERIGRLVDLE